jgi:hypothetical protein
MSGRNGDDRRLVHLIGAADEFRTNRPSADLPRSRFPVRRCDREFCLRSAMPHEEAAEQLTREATRRFERRETPTDAAPEFSYYLNYNGLDRYNRQGVTFVFDREKRQFHYDGPRGARSYADTPIVARRERPGID